MDFNLRVFLDIMCFKDIPVIKFIDKATGLRATKFPESVSAVDIWESILS